NNWKLYRYVVARRLREACEKVGVDPRELLNTAARLGGVGGVVVGAVGVGEVTEALRLVAEGLELEEAFLLKARARTATYKFYKSLFGEPYASMFFKPVLSSEPFLAKDPEALFEYYCKSVRMEVSGSDELVLAARLLYTFPFNRLLTESSITVCEEDGDVSVDLWVPESLLEYFEESGHLVAALANSKAITLKLWEACQEKPYEVDLNDIARIQIKDVEIEIPAIIYSTKKAEKFKELAIDPTFKKSRDNMRINMIKAAEELKILKR
ncbi:MAG: hypothetical protein ACPLSM_05665, partial [Thermosphaera sp.]